jgi:lysophospholipid acyltransferase (LPLAT)-like uncharacterized protein
MKVKKKKYRSQRYIKTFTFLEVILLPLFFFHHITKLKKISFAFDVNKKGEKIILMFWHHLLALSIYLVSRTQQKLLL